MWHGIQTLARWRSSAVSLTLGLALLVAACGPAGVTTKPTPTVAPTKTPIPACVTWSVVASPTTTQYPLSALRGVVALSPTEAWAVGSTYRHEETLVQAASLIERWNGSSWSIVASPGGGFLDSVAAVSANDIWAVSGLSGQLPGVAPYTYNTMIVHWNGTQWSVVPGAPASSSLDAIVARASNDVWAVGSTTSAGIMRPLAIHWNGSAWQVVTTPAPTGATKSYFSAVAAVPGTNQLWAVGLALKAPGVTALIERWDGSSWTIVNGPTLPAGASGSTLNSVVALSATDVWAVGSYTTASVPSPHALIAHWDGTSWTVVSSPNVWGTLTSVAAVGTHDVRAVGFRNSDTPTSNVIGIVERWDGATWSVADLPMPQGVSDTWPDTIAADGAGGYWMTGYSFTPSSNYRSLIARCG